jgi:glutamate racemase
MSKIAVIAGTPVDTQMGVTFLKQATIASVGFSVSKDPVAQTYFQTLPLATRTEQISNLVGDIKERGFDAILVYCNSLSAAIDFERLSEVFAITIVTPMQVYAKLARDYQRVGVLAANAQGSAGIEQALVQSNCDIQVYHATNLDWVKAVEANTPPDQIVNQFGLPATLTFFSENKVDAILIGCTHFPYFLAAYQARTNLPCLNPDHYLLALLTKK